MNMQRAKKKPTFDRSVMMTFIVASLIGVLVSGYKLLTYQDCTAADFFTGEEAPVAGKIVSFEDRTPGAKRWEWDFGDESPRSDKPKVMHVYESPGEYWVSLRVNGKCEVRKKVTVNNSRPVVDSSNYPRFNAPLTAQIGEKLEFRDNTPGAESWQWSFGESGKIDATDSSPVYVYKSAGTKTITLVVNGKSQFAATRRITVFSKPVSSGRRNSAGAGALPPPKPSGGASVAPQISKVQFQEWLMQVAEERREAETLATYCCNGLDATTRANGKGLTLGQLCDDIKGKKIVIENLELIKGGKTMCIEYINISYKKRILGIF